MLSDLFLSPLRLVIYLAALVVAITIHEYAHAAAADRLGDPTARLKGRKTLNPLAHLDPLGTLMLLLFRFGWGKPVPIDSFNLRNPRRDAALISLAGPGTNLIFALILSLILRIGLFFGPLPLKAFLAVIFEPIIVLNVALGIFNLLPFHPLDGGKILVGILPSELAEEWDRILSQYGLIILIFLLLPVMGTSPVYALVFPVINLILRLFLPGGSGLI
ncbi:site-2 protease family protein [Candidatus Shapirobacteria bacterium]|nr:site-2 protease family protein [Candidatus Shapirobacteria bacterium]